MSIEAPSMLDIVADLANTIVGNLGAQQSALQAGGQLAGEAQEASKDAIAAHNAANDATAAAQEANAIVGQMQAALPDFDPTTPQGQAAQAALNDAIAAQNKANAFAANANSEAQGTQSIADAIYSDLRA